MSGRPSWVCGGARGRARPAPFGVSRASGFDASTPTARYQIARSAEAAPRGRPRHARAARSRDHAPPHRAAARRAPHRGGRDDRAELLLPHAPRRAAAPARGTSHRGPRARRQIPRRRPRGRLAPAPPPRDDGPALRRRRDERSPALRDRARLARPRRAARLRAGCAHPPPPPPRRRRATGLLPRRAQIRQGPVARARRAERTPRPARDRRPRALRGRALPRLPPAARGDQGGAARSIGRRGRREHLRRRSALHGGRAARAGGRAGHAPRMRGDHRGTPARAAALDRDRRLEHQRLRRTGRIGRRLPGRTQGLRPHRGALPRLRRSDQAADRGAATDSTSPA